MNELWEKKIDLEMLSKYLHKRYHISEESTKSMLLKVAM
jgi:hypothetical protein